jgi:hypothetical protein
LWAGLALGLPANAEEPLWGETASTLGEGFFDVTAQGAFLSSEPYLHHGGPVLLTIDRTNAETRAQYGLRPDLDLHLRVTYFDETIKESFAGQSISQPLSGWGETLLGAKWRFRQSITERHKDELALMLDLKLPTGPSHLRDKTGLEIEPHLQPNSGNPGIVLGMAANRLTPRGGYWLSGLVGAEAASSRYYRGPMLELNASAGRRVRPFTRSSRMDWMGIAGLHFYWLGKDSQGGHPLRDSGGSILSAELGIEGALGSHGARLGILLPVHTDLGQAEAPPRREIQASIYTTF